MNVQEAPYRAPLTTAGRRRGGGIQVALATMLLVAVAIGVGLAASSMQHSDHPAPDRSPGESSRPHTAGGNASTLPVETMQVQRVESYARERTFTGIIKPARQSELSFERQGEVVEVSADLGDRVEKGQPLARIGDRRLKVKRLGLEAQHREALAVLAELEAGPRKESIAAQRATVQDLAAQVDAADQMAKRRQRLLLASASSHEEAEQAAFSLTAVEARLQSAQKVLDELTAGTRQERLDAQKAIVAQFDASIQDVDIEIEKSQMLAPYDAFVTERSVDEGSIAQPGSTIFRIIEDTSLEVWVGVPTAIAASIQAGEKLPVIVRKQSFDATVRSRIADLDHQTLTQTIVLTLDDVSPQQIVPGEVARLAFTQEIPVDGFWIPLAAISRGGQGLWSVLAVVGDGDATTTTERRDVDLIETQGERALVRGTLETGDWIVSSGTHRLTTKQAIRVPEPTDEVDESATAPATEPASQDVMSPAEKPPEPLDLVPTPRSDRPIASLAPTAS
ncbi:efflux RND transporter periplasmic adaptor subunit [Rosistilla oblonga]|uniref:efflux RND transporter periplasmic adaptor subunit n=1 Tax=Rosistilla oblonga TaxID=2527990 RepID=UPI003A980785